MDKLRDVHFGNSNRDVNLCHPSTQFYKLKNGSLDLSKSTSTTTLISKTLPELRLTLTLLKSGIVNIHWTLNGKRKPIEVPLDIV